ncbi:MAG: cell division/cell wall cluster transcriptional repressor MraZ, partial [Gammaproteobacteria bacterium]|nr:cell division/cell wall cluster transcriptional repressor MraZ [Gammaproteobacteria bacterium]
QRLLIGHATDLELDGSGRLLLPVQLRNHAGLDKKLTLAGQGNKIEIWDEAKWREGMALWRSEENDELAAEFEGITGLSV